MALNIPMPDSPGDSLIKGLDAGGDLIHKLMLNKYYNQPHASGDVANAMYVEQLRNQLGENDPRYLNAKQALELSLQGRQSLIDYRDALNQTAGIRATSPLGKLIAESQGHGAQDILNNKGGKGSNADVGYTYDENGNNVMATSDEANQTANGNSNNTRTPQEQELYDRAINKSTSDADTRKRMRFAENLDITRHSINPEDLTRYSGLKGIANYIKDTAQATIGNPPNQWTAHKDAMTAASLMTKQLQQFYGSSIQPAAMLELKKLTNPSTPFNDSKVAQSQWNQLNKILDQETATYKKYGTTPNKLDYIDGKFVVGNSNQNNKQSSSQVTKGISPESGGFDPKKILDYKYGSKEEFLNAFNSLDDKSKAIVTAEMKKRGLH